MNQLLCEIASKDANLDSSDLKELGKVSLEASKIGSKVLMSKYGKIRDVKSKGSGGNLVTSADLESEQAVIQYLRKECPEISILAEESGYIGNSDSLTWCIDPLDGTTNYAHGYPFFSTSIGLVWKKVPLLGAISAPALRENFWGIPGVGAFCNGEKIFASKTNSLQDSLLVTGFAYDRVKIKDNNYAEFCWLTHRTQGVRRAGAASVDLAYVACGKIDGYWERGLSAWDVAAGIPIAELAGCKICDYKGGGFDLTNGRVFACTPSLKEPLLNELKKVQPLPEVTYGTAKYN
ncbi:inositol monophosphatase family protein [Prochlorococcus sp. MIT 1341]|uniref:inositol monophosphatase family protein n=1 Tax=Prochlorococcus sp. MIT 1341 TaxID=3096221 RepID=UPI002A754C4D|nr:inositol monophosphatase family protein [Prochlorococcus sp. MIT 1341]